MILENICFGEDGKAVLIDLDMCTAIGEMMERYQSGFLMYPFHNTWTYKNWDYVQLGLMIIRVISRITIMINQTSRKLI